MKQKQILVGIGISVIILISIAGLYFNAKLRSGITVGKAFNINEIPWTGGEIHLEEEETATFTLLPEDTGDITITTPLARTDPETLRLDIGTFTFQLKKRDAGSFNFTLSDENEDLVAQDVLTLGATKDSSLVYLDSQDSFPDLEVFAQNGRITIRNLHFISPDKSQITLFPVNADNTLGTPYSQLIRVPLNTDFTAAVKAVSSFPPLIGARAPAVVDEPTLNAQENSAIAMLTYPGRSTPGVATLHLNATINTLVTNTYYILAFDNLAFNQVQPGYPNITVTLTGAAGRDSRLDLAFQPTEELQPLAIPCKLTQASLSSLFANSVVEHIYSWNPGTQKSEVWNVNAPGELSSFANFRGYYVKLRPLTAADRLSFQFPCKAQILQSVTSATPAAIIQTQSLPVGWSLLSLPGTVPRPLTDFTLERSFEVQQCAQNNVCTTLTPGTFLTPGKPYWVKTNVPITLSYTLEE